MDGSVRELITLQVGHYANFIGTHWWNLQEASFVYDNPSGTDINHDFLFKEGITLQRQETYTPRLLAIDFKGNLHSLATSGSLYNPLRSDPSTSEASWDGPVELIRQIPQEKNEFLLDLEQEDTVHFFPTDEDKDICIDDTIADSKVANSVPVSLQKVYDLSNSVKVWSDYLRPHLHPNSVYLLDDNYIVSGSASEEGSWGFPSGTMLWQREEVEDTITDRIRILAEACGSLQGFQMICDVQDGMGGISNGILLHLEDEYRSKDYITFAATPPHLSPTIPQSKLLIQSSIIQSYTMLSNLSGMFIPLSLRHSCLDLQSPPVSFPHMSLQTNSAYKTSSVLASFIDTASLAYRVRNAPMLLSNAIEFLTLPGRQVVGGSLALPLGLGNDQYLMEWLQNGNPPHLVPLSADADLNEDPLSEMRMIRGIYPSTLLSPDTKLPPGRQFNTAYQMYQDFLHESRIPPSRRVVVGARDPLKTTSPFPSIFTGVTKDGYVSSSNLTATQAVKSVPCIAGLHQGGGIGHLLQKLLFAAEKLDVAKIPRLIDEGMDKESWADVTEQLREINGVYITKKAEGRSSDDD